MEFSQKRLNGVVEIKLKPIFDERGFFMRTYDLNLFEKYGINIKWVQENHSRSIKKGIIRGLHFQFPPYTEAKLVRCIKGAVFDVFVDLRKNSSTFGQWDSIILSEDNHKMVFIPRGFAHGFCTLTDISEVTYKVDNYYNPKYEGGIIWNDEILKINWPAKNPIISYKDRMNMSFGEFKEKYIGLIV